MATAQDLIKAAMHNIGKLAPDEALTTEDADVGLTTLNRMLELWSVQRLMVYSRVIENFTLVVGTVSYTIGSGATWDTVIPQRVEGAYIRDSDGNDYPLGIIRDRAQYDHIRDKDASYRPDRLYFDPQYPQATIYFDSAPAAAEVVYIISWKEITAFAALTTTVSLPAGYEAAIEYNLPKFLAPKFGTTVPPSIDELARATMKIIKGFNKKPMISPLDLPAGRLGNGNDGYDITTGEFYRG